MDPKPFTSVTQMEIFLRIAEATVDGVEWYKSDSTDLSALSALVRNEWVDQLGHSTYVLNPSACERIPNLKEWREERVHQDS